MVLQKNIVMVLVVIAVILAGITIYFIISDSEVKVSTENSNAGSEDSGQVGVTIVSPAVEDKLVGEGNGE